MKTTSKQLWRFLYYFAILFFISAIAIEFIQSRTNLQNRPFLVLAFGLALVFGLMVVANLIIMFMLKYKKK